MEDISRKQLDRISILLQNHIGTDESIKLASKLTNADIIPKLYVYTYLKKIRETMKEWKVNSKEFDMEEWESLADQLPALNLNIFRNKREVRVASEFIHNAFEREDKFCDFDDSKFHGERMIGSCQNEDHETSVWDGENYVEKKNENLVLQAVYMPDEFTAKFEDTPEWWCKDCCDALDPGDCDVTVSCDMDMEE